MKEESKLKQALINYPNTATERLNRAMKQLAKAQREMGEADKADAHAPAVLWPLKDLEETCHVDL